MAMLVHLAVVPALASLAFETQIQTEMSHAAGPGYPKPLPISEVGADHYQRWCPVQRSAPGGSAVCQQRGLRHSAGCNLWAVLSA